MTIEYDFIKEMERSKKILPKFYDKKYYDGTEGQGILEE